MNDKKCLTFHQKSKSINNKNYVLKNIEFENLTSTYNNNRHSNNKEEPSEKIIINERKTSPLSNSKEELNFCKTLDEMRQSVLDLYYNKNSLFKNKIDNLNLQFYLETEKYLKYFNLNNHAMYQKIQANLFIILFKQINLYIQEIERLNKIIIDNKYQKEQIYQRTSEINKKQENILIKDNLIQYLKKSNTNTEKKLLEALLNEDKLLKDNERLRKENETYKSLTIVFENELKNTIKKSGLTPQKNKIARHIKTYSDYGLPNNSIINELCYHNNNEETANEDKNTKELKLTNRIKKFSYKPKVAKKKIQLHSNSINLEKKVKNFNKYKKLSKIPKKQILTEYKSLGMKKSQDKKNKYKNDTLDKPEGNKSKGKITNDNLSYNFTYNKKNNKTDNKSEITNKNKKNIKKFVNMDSNNINTTVGTKMNAMTQATNFSDNKEIQTKNNNESKKYFHKKQKTMSEISFNEIVRIKILNDELDNGKGYKDNYKMVLKDEKIAKKSSNLKNSKKNIK